MRKLLHKKKVKIIIFYEKSAIIFAYVKKKLYLCRLNVGEE